MNIKFDIQEMLYNKRKFKKMHKIGGSAKFVHFSQTYASMPVTQVTKSAGTLIFSSSSTVSMCTFLKQGSYSYK